MKRRESNKYLQQGLSLLKTVLVIHVFVIGFSSLILIFPNPVKVLSNYPSLENSGEPYEIVLTQESREVVIFRNADSDRLILICHGKSRRKEHMLPLAIELRHRWNVALFDFPNHGGNGVGITSTGLNEAEYLVTVLKTIREEGFKDVAIYGVSMGGAAALRYLSGNPLEIVKGLITDGVFRDFSELVENTGDRWFIPHYISYAAVSFASVLSSNSLNANNPQEFLERVSVPVLILHGKSDTIVPVELSLATVTSKNYMKKFIYAGVHDEPKNLAMQAQLTSFIVNELSFDD